MRISFPDHVRGEREGTVVGERGKPGILRWASADLNEKCAEQEPGRERERLSQTRSPGKKPQRCENEDCDGKGPPRGRAPGSDARPEAERKSQGRPEHRLAGRLPFVNHFVDLRWRDGRPRPVARLGFT